MKDWFKARNIWGAAFLSLSDAEAGRLAKALWSYTMGIELPNPSGAEKASFAMFQMALAQDDAEIGNLSEKRRSAGSKGGLQKVANQANATFATENVANQANATNKNKNKNKNKEKEEDKDNDNNNSACAWLSDDEIAESLDRDRQIEDAAKRWGLPCQEGHMIHARDLARDYTLPWLLRAIETAGNGKEQTWRYVGGILKSWKDTGGPDAPRKQRSSPGKTVSAQNYTQRDYTPEELDAVSGDLLSEARAQREATA